MDERSSRTGERTRSVSGRIGRGPIRKLTTGGDPVGTETFIDGPIEGVVVRPLKPFHDARGWLVELFRHDEVDPSRWPVMAYASMTLPGVARGPHEHADQTDGFAFFGPSDFRLWCWDTREGSPTRGHRLTLIVGQSHPAAVWIPPGVVHAYRNVGDVPGLVVNAPNRLYAGWNKAEPVDEIRHEETGNERFPLVE